MKLGKSKNHRQATDREILCIANMDAIWRKNKPTQEDLNRCVANFIKYMPQKTLELDGQLSDIKNTPS